MPFPSAISSPTAAGDRLLGALIGAADVAVWTFLIPVEALGGLALI